MASAAEVEQSDTSGSTVHVRTSGVQGKALFNDGPSKLLVVDGGLSNGWQLGICENPANAGEENLQMSMETAVEEKL